MPQAKASLDHALIALLVTKTREGGSIATAATAQLIEHLRQHHPRYLKRRREVRGEFNRDDFAQNFALEVMAALKSFDPARGTEFASYIWSFVDSAYAETMRQLTGMRSGELALSLEASPAIYAAAEWQTHEEFNLTAVELVEGLKMLTALQAVSFIQCELEGAKAKELAVLLGIVPSAVTHAIRRARRTLMPCISR